MNMSNACIPWARPATRAKDSNWPNNPTVKYISHFPEEKADHFIWQRIWRKRPDGKKKCFASALRLLLAVKGKLAGRTYADWDRV